MPIFHHDGTITHVGCVLDKGEMNYYDDSDFYAVVWDEEKQNITRIEYDSTRYAGGGGASIDATPEVIEKASKYVYDHLFAVWNRKNEEQSKIARKGNTVKVVRGTKAPVGSIGVLFWIGEARKYGYYSKPTQKVGIATSDRVDHKGKRLDVVWTYLHNVEPIDPTLNLEPEEQGRWYAERNKTSWRTFTYAGLPIF